MKKLILLVLGTLVLGMLALGTPGCKTILGPVSLGSRHPEVDMYGGPSL